MYFIYTYVLYLSFVSNNYWINYINFCSILIKILEYFGNYNRLIHIYMSEVLQRIDFARHVCSDAKIERRKHSARASVEFRHAGRYANARINRSTGRSSYQNRWYEKPGISIKLITHIRVMRRQRGGRGGQPGSRKDGGGRGMLQGKRYLCAAGRSIAI